MADLEPRIRRAPDGDIELRFPAEERAVIRTLPGQLRASLGSMASGTERLFPPASLDDPAVEAAYRELVGTQLEDGRLRSIETMEETTGASRLDREQAEAWLSVLNDLRLVLGSRLQVTEESAQREIAETDPEGPAYAMFHYLGWLVEQLVAAVED
jgi:hypothetical protein